MPTSAKPRVLIVDDDAESAELTMRRLKALDADLEFHQGPFGTVAAIRAGGYDLVLLDVNMPALTGPQILRMVREGDPSQSRVVFYSSNDEDQLRQLALESGAHGYVSKSASKAKFVTEIEAILGVMP